MSSKKQYFIGDESDYNQYVKNNGKEQSVMDLPIKNLPMNYFPFFYNTSENSIAKIQKLVPLFENYTKNVESKGTDCNTTASSFDVNTDSLFSLLSSLEEPYQPFNKNNVRHLMFIVVVLWGIIALFILKVISVFLKEYYVYFILSAILVLLVFGVIWTMFITNTVI